MLLLVSEVGLIESHEALLKIVATQLRASCPRFVMVRVSGGKLWIMLNGPNFLLTDEKGNTSNVTIADVMQSNGVIHVVDRVVLPN